MTKNNNQIFVVTSLRDYADGEIYFGADGLFETFEKAREYIKDDMEETFSDRERPIDLEEKLSHTGADALAQYTVVDGDHTFCWKIDTFTI